MMNLKALVTILVLTFLVPLAASCASDIESAPPLEKPTQVEDRPPPENLDPSVPRLVSPASGAVMDNGDTGRADGIVWDFDWSDVNGATQYQLYVIHQGSANPVIDTTTPSSSFHHLSQGSYVADFNRYAWTWKVRAQVDGQWKDWSEVRIFDVEPVNTDISPTPTVTPPPTQITPTARVVKVYSAPG